MFWLGVRRIAQNQIIFSISSTMPGLCRGRNDLIDDLPAALDRIRTVVGDLQA